MAQAGRDDIQQNKLKVAMVTAVNRDIQLAMNGRACRHNSSFFAFVSTLI
jgi:hypothetical protein